MNFQNVINEVYQEVTSKNLEGKVSESIPELAAIDASKFGIHVTTLSNDDYGIGDSLERFSIQSVSKPLTLAMVFTVLGETLWERVGVEPSGDPFNSLVQLEYEKGIPRNPFINAGAIVIADMIVSSFSNPKQDFLDFLKKITGSYTINFNPRVARSESDFGHRNRALAHFLKSFGNIKNDVDAVLDFYFHQCSVEMSCKELAQAFYFFANRGKTKENIQIITESQAKRLNAIMQTCGFYDESGEFTYKVGLPGKSGIGGGIVALYPQKFVIATWNPRLNEKGNSEMGMHALELFTTKTGLSIF